MRDKYNLNTLPKGSEEAEYEDVMMEQPIPGMDFGDQEFEDEVMANGTIPGLSLNDENKEQQRKVPYAKPIPKQFQQQWNGDTKRLSPQSNNSQIVDMPTPGAQMPSNMMPGPIPRSFGNPVGQNMMANQLPHRMGGPGVQDSRSLIGPPGMPLQSHHANHMPANSQVNIPPNLMMGSRMPHQMAPMMPPSGAVSHNMPDHNIRHDNFHVQNQRPNPIDRPLSPRSLNRDTDERFNLMNHFDEDLRRDRSDRHFEEHFDRPPYLRPDPRYVSFC